MSNRKILVIFLIALLLFTICLITAVCVLEGRIAELEEKEWELGLLNPVENPPVPCVKILYDYYGSENIFGTDALESDFMLIESSEDYEAFKARLQEVEASDHDRFYHMREIGSHFVFCNDEFDRTFFRDNILVVLSDWSECCGQAQFRLESFEVRNGVVHAEISMRVGVIGSMASKPGVIYFVPVAKTTKITDVELTTTFEVIEENPFVGDWR